MESNCVHLTAAIELLDFYNLNVLFMKGFNAIIFRSNRCGRRCLKFHMCAGNLHIFHSSSLNALVFLQSLDVVSRLCFETRHCGLFSS